MKLSSSFLHICHVPIYCTLYTIIEFAITLLPHLAHGSTLLLSTSPFEPLTITLVFLRFTFSPLLSNASFHFKNFSFRFSVLLLIKTKSSTYKILLINPSLAFSEITSTAIAKAVATTHILDVHLFVLRILQITQITLELLFFPGGRSSSPLLKLLLVNLSFSLSTPLPFLELHQMPSQYPQNTFTTFSSYPYIPLAFFVLQTMRLSFLFQA